MEEQGTLRAETAKLGDEAGEEPEAVRRAKDEIEKLGEMSAKQDDLASKTDHASKKAGPKSKA